MNPRRMSDILGLMSPEAAERLTVELANRSGAVGKAHARRAELPKIEGRPTVVRRPTSRSWVFANIRYA